MRLELYLYRRHSSMLRMKECFRRILTSSFCKLYKPCSRIFVLSQQHRAVIASLSHCYPRCRWVPRQTLLQLADLPRRCNLPSLGDTSESKSVKNSPLSCVVRIQVGENDKTLLFPKKNAELEALKSSCTTGPNFRTRFVDLDRWCRKHAPSSRGKR